MKETGKIRGDGKTRYK